MFVSLIVDNEFDFNVDIKIEMSKKRYVGLRTVIHLSSYEEVTKHPPKFISVLRVEWP